MIQIEAGLRNGTGFYYTALRIIAEFVYAVGTVLVIGSRHRAQNPKNAIIEMKIDYKMIPISPDCGNHIPGIIINIPSKIPIKKLSFPLYKNQKL